MSIYKKLGKMNSDKSLEEKLYELLQTDTYKTDVYKTSDLGEGMAVLYKNYKPWFVLNHNKKTAFEFMDNSKTLVTVTEDDVDWESLKKLPENAVYVAQCLSFHYPSFIRAFKNGVAEVEWQLNPDNTEGKVVVKFQTVSDYKDLEKLRKEAEEKVLKTTK